MLKMTWARLFLLIAVSSNSAIAQSDQPVSTDTEARLFQQTLANGKQTFNLNQFKFTARQRASKTGATITKRNFVCDSKLPITILGAFPKVVFRLGDLECAGENSVELRQMKAIGSLLSFSAVHTPGVEKKTLFRLDLDLSNERKEELRSLTNDKTFKAITSDESLFLDYRAESKVRDNQGQATQYYFSAEVSPIKDSSDKKIELYYAKWDEVETFTIEGTANFK